jgi:hypothetical protein
MSFRPGKPLTERREFTTASRTRSRPPNTSRPWSVVDSGIPRHPFTPVGADGNWSRVCNDASLRVFDQVNDLGLEDAVELRRMERMEIDERTES